MDLTPVPVPAPATAALCAFAREAERAMASVPGPDEVPVDVARAQQSELAPPRSERATEDVVTALGRTVRIRVFANDSPSGVYLHIHGGGWTMGAADEQDDRLEEIADETGAAVVSIEYRLAPEHPHPAAADDCEAVACWLVEHAPERFGTDRLVVGGESAGAHLALVTLLRLRDRHGMVGAFCGANLVYGLYDLTLTPSVAERGDRRIVLSEPIIRYHRAALLGDEVDPSDPDVSPLRAPLHDLPSSLISVGTDDPLRDDSVFLAARLQLAGSPPTLDLYEGGFHAFNLFPGAVAEVCNRRQHAYLTAAFADRLTHATNGART